ncbi:MAG TPA: retropepsin-like aspartic protease [Pyrinomonadaceae bacterium]|nr:retropepsin-like aspartic protease [Pyrinomonadaceae bacterium]
MAKHLVQLALLIMLATQSIPAQQSKPAVSEVPFSFKKGFVIVEAKIKGNVPVNVILATGTENSVTDPSFLKKYDLSAGYAGEGPVTGRNDKTYYFAIVKDVSVGATKSSAMRMRFGSLSDVSNAVGQEIFATLGADFFRDQAVQFDFKNKVIRFFDKTPPELVDNKNPSFNAAKTTVLQMAPKPSNPFQATILVPVVKDVLLNGQKVNLLMDTGVATSIALSSSTAKKVALALPDENGPPREGKVTLRLESYELTDLPIWIFAKGTSADQKLSQYGAVAGSAFLQNFVVTFDYKKSVVVLERF